MPSEMNKIGPDQGVESLMRRLLHPLWWTALVLMITNDHLFKGGGLIPVEIAGKLSDFTGMIVAPVLLAILLRVRTRRGLLLVHLLVGGTFAAINLSGAMAAGFDAMTALTGFAWRTTVDTTDLMALPMLGASWWLLTTRTLAPLRKGTIQAWGQRVALVTGSMFCMANQPPNPDPMPRSLIFPQINAALVVGNDTPNTLNFRVRPLKDSIILNCDAVSQDPQTLLSNESFGPAVVWQVEPGRAFAPREEVGVPTECDAFLIDGADIPPTLLFWKSADFGAQMLPSTVEEGIDSGRLITVSGDPTQELLRWSDHDARFAPPSSVDPHAELCGIPKPTVGVAWETPVPAGGIIQSLATAPDGCMRLSIGPDGGPISDWFVCGVAGIQLPFVAGDSIDIVEFSTGQELQPITGINFFSDRYTVRLARGFDIVTFGAGKVDIDLDPECAGSHSACGDYRQPLQISIAEEGHHTALLRAGDSVELAQGGTLYVLRAESLPVANTACDGADDTIETGISIHSMFVELHDDGASPDLNP